MYYYLLTAILFVGCGSNIEDLTMQQNEQNWKLIKMTGSFIGSETTGSAMEYQENINLKSDSSFIKVRTNNSNIQSASGTYTILELEDGMYLELSYSTESVLLGNCTGNLKEVYWIVSDNQLNGTWMACDGPGLEYELN